MPITYGAANAGQSLEKKNKKKKTTPAVTADEDGELMAKVSRCRRVGKFSGFVQGCGNHVGSSVCPPVGGRRKNRALATLGSLKRDSVTRPFVMSQRAQNTNPPNYWLHTLRPPCFCRLAREGPNKASVLAGC